MGSWQLYTSPRKVNQRFTNQPPRLLDSAVDWSLELWGASLLPWECQQLPVRNQNHTMPCHGSKLFVLLGGVGGVWFREGRPCECSSEAFAGTLGPDLAWLVGSLVAASSSWEVVSTDSTITKQKWMHHYENRGMPQVFLLTLFMVNYEGPAGMCKSVFAMF